VEAIGHHSGAGSNRNPTTRPEPPEEGRSVFELLGNEMDDFPLALHLAPYPHEPRPEQGPGGHDIPSSLRAEV
jgi:hypothetical protein